ncbi:MAG: hypothetical protein ABI209_01815 [Edaphobacter sp.]
MRSKVLLYMSLTVSVLAGCADKTCDKADSQAVCKQTQLCFDSGTSTTSCRTAEKAAREYEANYRKNIAPALGGAADALRYDPSKAPKPPQPPPPQQQPQQQPRKQ